MTRSDADTRCRRCGTCCEKGGPSLHQEDRHLVESGAIPAHCLFTMRRGELARDNVKDLLLPLEQELIKIKGQDGRWTCRFYDREGRGCTIYDRRPLECRALNCRDTHRIEAVYATERLTRKDLLLGVAGLWELVEDHEERCGYDRLGRLVAQGLDNSSEQLVAKDDILQTLRYDAELRRLAVDKGGMAAGILAFVFGRPLSETIGMYGLRLEKTADGYRLVPTSAFRLRLRD